MKKEERDRETRKEREGITTAHFILCFPRAKEYLAGKENCPEHFFQ